MYQRPLRPDELMHFGVKGMHWGVRKSRKLWSKNASDMRKISRIKARMSRHLTKRQDTKMMLDKANEAERHGQIFKSKVIKKFANLNDPIHMIRAGNVKRLNKRIKKRIAKISQMQPSISEYYTNIGEEYYRKALARKSYV